MSFEAYTLVFAPRYGVQAGSFTLTGDRRSLAYQLAMMLEALPATKGPWHVREDEENGTLLLQNNGVTITCITTPSQLHEAALTWAALDGRYIALMFNATC